jgi:hypothetical protein
MSTNFISDNNIKAYLQGGLQGYNGYRPIFTGLGITTRFMDISIGKTVEKQWVMEDGDIKAEQFLYEANVYKQVGGTEIDKSYVKRLYNILTKYHADQNVNPTEIVNKIVSRLLIQWDSQFFYDTENPSAFNVAANGAENVISDTFTSGADLYTKLLSLVSDFRQENDGVRPVMLVGKTINGAIKGTPYGTDNTVWDKLQSSGEVSITDAGSAMMGLIPDKVYKLNGASTYFTDNTVALLNPAGLVIKHGSLPTDSDSVSVESYHKDREILFSMESAKLESDKPKSIFYQDLTQA